MAAYQKLLFSLRQSCPKASLHKPRNFCSATERALSTSFCCCMEGSDMSLPQCHQKDSSHSELVSLAPLVFKPIALCGRGVLLQLRRQSRSQIVLPLSASSNSAPSPIKSNLQVALSQVRKEKGSEAELSKVMKSPPPSFAVPLDRPWRSRRGRRPRKMMWKASRSGARKKRKSSNWPHQLENIQLCDAPKNGYQKSSLRRCLGGFCQFE